MRYEAGSLAGGKKMKMKHLSRSILVWMVILSMLPLSIVAFQGLHCARQAISSLAESHLISIAEMEKAKLVQWLKSIEMDARLMAGNSCIRGQCIHASSVTGLQNLSSTCTTQYCGKYNIPKDFSDYESIYFFDSKWNATKLGAKKGAPEVLLSRDIEKTLNRIKGIYFFHLESTFNGEYYLWAAYPVVTDKGAKLGTLIIGVPLKSSLEKILSVKSGIGKKVRVFVLTHKKTLLVSSVIDRFHNGHNSKINTFLLANLVPGVVKYEKVDGVSIMTTAEKIPIVGWKIIVEEDFDVAYAWLNVLKDRAIITAVVTFFMVFIFATLIAKRLSSPLREIADVAREITRGNKDERVKDFDYVEAHEVATAFNLMLDQLEESRLRLTQAASLAAVGELSSSIVHEIRNPLSSVKLNLQAICIKVKGDDVYRELADIALAQTKRMEQMLNELLSYGKPLKLNYDNFSFNDISFIVEDLLDERLRRKKIKIRIEDQTGGKRFTLDIEQFKRVLSNLLSNAANASGEGDEIVVSASVKHGKEEMLQVIVRDFGKGIPEANLEKIFQPFFTTREDGFGLGLSNVKKIIDYHGGKIWAENHHDGGAIFVVQIPLRRKIDGYDTHSG